MYCINVCVYQLGLLVFHNCIYFMQKVNSIDQNNAFITSFNLSINSIRKIMRGCRFHFHNINSWAFLLSSWRSIAHPWKKSCLIQKLSASWNINLALLDNFIDQLLNIKTIQWGISIWMSQPDEAHIFLSISKYENIDDMQQQTLLILSNFINGPRKYIIMIKSNIQLLFLQSINSNVLNSAKAFELCMYLAIKPNKKNKNDKSRNVRKSCRE